MNGSFFSRAALVALTLWTLCGTAAFGAEPGKNYVVLFAGETFPKSEDKDGVPLNPLAGTVNDMRNLEERWIRPQRELAEKSASVERRDDGLEIAPFEFKTTFSDDAIIRLYDADPATAPGSTKAPTKRNFLNAVDEVVNKATKNDVVYVFASTHGIAIGEKSYLCPENCGDFKAPREKDESDADFANRINLIPVADLIERLGSCPAECALALDACRDYGNSGTNLLKEISELVQKHENVTVITACALGQSSRMMDERGVSAFFHYFTEGLEGAADAQGAYDGRVTLVEAFNYAYSRTGDYARSASKEDGKSAQTPEWYGTGDVVPAIVPDSLTVGFDEDAHDYQLALSCGDRILRADQSARLDVAKGRANASSIKVDEDGLLEKTFKYVIDSQPHNTAARYLRGYVLRAKARYKDAIEDFNKAGFEMVLFVTKEKDFGNGPGTYAYGSSDVKEKLTGKNPKGGEELLYYPLGSRIIVDKWKNDRFHVVTCNNEESGNWISDKYVSWTPQQAETTVANGYSVASNSRSSRGARTTIEDNPIVPASIDVFN